MDDSESNALTEKDIVEVAERKDRADDPLHADRKLRDVHDGTDALTDVQRLWLCHLAFPPAPNAARVRVRGWVCHQCTPSVGTRLVGIGSMLCQEIPRHSSAPGSLQGRALTRVCRDARLRFPTDGRTAALVSCGAAAP